MEVSCMYEREPVPRKVFLQPEDFSGSLTARHLKIILDHQTKAFNDNTFIADPLPPTKSKRLTELFEDFAANREIYDDYEHIDQLISNDEIVRSVCPKDPTADTKPEQSRAIRIRSSILAARYIIMDQYSELPEQSDATETEENTIQSRVA